MRTINTLRSMAYQSRRHFVHTGSARFIERCLGPHTMFSAISRLKGQPDSVRLSEIGGGFVRKTNVFRTARKIR